MPNFNISGGNSVTYIDTTPSTGLVIDLDSLDNSFNVQINGVDLFVGGPATAPNEVQFWNQGQNIRFADGDVYQGAVPAIWNLANNNGNPIVRLEINPDGTILLSGVKSSNGTLEPLELFNGLSVNTAAIAAAWNSTGSNTIVVDQAVVGKTNATGDFEDVPCFVAGTLISTVHGDVPVENLSEGDDVLVYQTDDESSAIERKVRRIFRRKVSIKNPKLRPVRIKAGTLGKFLPRRDLLVSRQHRMLVKSKLAGQMFGENEVLIPAIKLTILPGISVETEVKAVEYFHILLDRHEIIYAECAPAESLFTGAEALKAIGPEAREEIMSLFPEIADIRYTPIPARYLPEGKEQKRLIERHLKKGVPCLTMVS